MKENLKVLVESKVCTFTVEANKREELIIAVEYEGDYKVMCSQIKQTLVKFLGLAPYDVILVPKGEIPHTDNGKLSIKQAAHSYQSNKMQINYNMRNATTEIETGSFSKIGEKIKEIFESILGVRCYSVNNNFFELGGNSLHTLSLLKRLKAEFGVYITTDELLESATVESIEACIQKKLKC